MYCLTGKYIILYSLFQGILLVYDITNVDSFNHLSHWIRNLSDVSKIDHTFIIIL